MELSRKYEFGERMTDEDSLAHFGVKGMKWGVRRGKSKTGITRHRGAIIDRNDRQISAIKKAQSGEKYKVTRKVGEALLGKETLQRNWQTSIRDLNDQNQRLRSGKLNLGDRLRLMTVTDIEMLVSVRPK